MVVPTLKPTRAKSMNKTHTELVERFAKFVTSNLMGTAADIAVLWLFPHFVIFNYGGNVSFLLLSLSNVRQW